MSGLNLKPLALLVFCVFLNQCVTYTSVHTQGDPRRREAAVPEDSGYKIEYEIKGYDKEEGPTWLAILSGVTLFVIPAYGTRTGDVHYYAKGPDGTKHLIETDRADGLTFLGWIFLPGSLIAPLFPNLAATVQGETELKAYVQENSAERFLDIRKSEKFHELYENDQRAKSEQRAAFQGLLAAGGRWEEFAELYYNAKEPELKQRLNQILKQGYEDWLKEEVQRKYGLDPLTNVFWADGDKWGPLWAMFRTILPVIPNDKGLTIDFRRGDQCEGGATYSATHCYLFNKSGEETFILFRLKSEKLYIVGMGSGIEVNPYNWEKAAGYLLYGMSEWLTDWSKVTNPSLLQYRLKPE